MTASLIPSGEQIHNALDVGCRDGRITNVLGSKVDIVGLDIGLESLAKVSGKKICGSIENLPFHYKAFDLTICTEVLEHLTLDSMKRGVSELQRVTRKFLLISVPFRESLVKGYVRCPKCKKIHHEYGHLRSFDIKKIAGLFAEFKVCDYRIFGDLDAKGLEAFYYIMHVIGKKWSSVEVDLCPYCGFHNLDKYPDNKLGCLVQRIIWFLEKISIYKVKTSLAVLLKVR